MTELNRGITKWAKAWNENPKPFIWTKSADEIFASMQKYLVLLFLSKLPMRDTRSWLRNSQTPGSQPGSTYPNDTVIAFVMPLNSLIGSALDDLTDRRKHAVERCFAGISPVVDSVRMVDEGFTVPIRGNPFLPWVLRFLLVEVIGCKDRGRSEKIAWSCELAIDGRLIEFSYRKFGLFALVHGCRDVAESDDVVRTVLTRFQTGIPLVERWLIRPRIENALREGRVSLENEFCHFLHMYEHFRQLSETSAREAVTLKPVKEVTPDFLSISFPAVERAHESEFEAHAALIALYSMLEHLLIIEFSLIQQDAHATGVEDFIRLRWSEKFKGVINLADSRVKQVYDQLGILADQNRNPAVHGGIGRSSSRMHVQLEGYGAVDVAIESGSQKRAAYTFLPTLPADLAPFYERPEDRARGTGWDIVEDLVGWMRHEHLSDAWNYGTSRLPIFLDDASRLEAWNERASGKFEDLLSRRSWISDQAANMDW